MYRTTQIDTNNFNSLTSLPKYKKPLITQISDLPEYLVQKKPLVPNKGQTSWGHMNRPRQQGSRVLCTFNIHDTYPQCEYTYGHIKRTVFMYEECRTKSHNSILTNC